MGSALHEKACRHMDKQRTNSYIYIACCHHLLDERLPLAFVPSNLSTSCTNRASLAGHEKGSLNPAPD